MGAEINDRSAGIFGMPLVAVASGAFALERFAKVVGRLKSGQKISS